MSGSTVWCSCSWNTHFLWVRLRHIAVDSPKHQRSILTYEAVRRAAVGSNRVEPGQGSIRTNQISIQNSSIRTCRTNSIDLKTGALGPKWNLLTLIEPSQR
jgi:hypothetical protein